jgi:uncharacterized protein YndB with AHSA1/START domain
MTAYDWSTFRLKININAPVENVFAAWTSRQGLERWFLRKALLFNHKSELKPLKELVQSGETYEWYWHGYPDTVLEKGTIISNNQVDTLRFTFAGTCEVTVSVYREQNESICELVQSNIPDDEASRVKFHLGCSNGWTFYLGNLKSILEGGLDLRNKNEALQAVVNA